MSRANGFTRDTVTGAAAAIPAIAAAGATDTDVQPSPISDKIVGGVEDGLFSERECVAISVTNARDGGRLPLSAY